MAFFSVRFVYFSLFFAFFIAFICLGQLEIFAFAVILSVLFFIHLSCAVGNTCVCFASVSRSLSLSLENGWMDE